MAPFHIRFDGRSVCLSTCPLICLVSLAVQCLSVVTRLVCLSIDPMACPSGQSLCLAVCLTIRWPVRLLV